MTATIRPTMAGVNDTQGLHPDSDGYLPVLLGTCNHVTQDGRFYHADAVEAAIERFRERATRSNGASARGEQDHPDIDYRQGDVVTNQARINEIREDRVSHQITKVELVKGEDGLARIIGYVRPQGPLGEALQNLLADETAKVAFGMRAFAVLDPVKAADPELVEQGITTIRESKHLEIVTFDWIDATHV